MSGLHIHNADSILQHDCRTSNFNIFHLTCHPIRTEYTQYRGGHISVENDNVDHGVKFLPLYLTAYLRGGNKGYHLLTCFDVCSHDLLASPLTGLRDPLPRPPIGHLPRRSRPHFHHLPRHQPHFCFLDSLPRPLFETC